MALQPHPTKTPITDQQTGLIARVWDAWFRDLYRYVVSLAVDTITAHLADTTGAHAATAISFTPTGTIAATDAQAAIAEAASESVAGIAAEASTRSAADTALTSALGAHTSNTSNPHATTADQVLPTQTGNSGKFLKTNGTASSWALAGGSGGVNFLGLDSTWAIATQDDRDFETSIGNWVAYADAAATSPVDMTGGSPGTTMTRVTVSQLNGVGSGKMDLGSGSSRQGEGISCVGYVPTGYRGQNVAFTGQYSITGANVDGDLKIFGYDVTNSELITPTSYGKILGTAGQFYAIFPTKTSTAQIRVGVHVARTTTAALSVLLDDLSVSPVIPAIGMAGSDTTSITLTPSAGFGTTTGGFYSETIVGDWAFYRGRFVCGTTAASTASIDLPTSRTIDTTGGKISAASSGMVVGYWKRVRSGVTATDPPSPVFFDGSDNNTLFFNENSTASSALTKFNGNALVSTGDLVEFEFSVPLAGRSSNLQMGESSVYRISNFLANGTRVTGAAPTRLGEYRSQLRNASASTFTDTNGTPGTLPSTANGMILYGGNGWGSADTSGEPSRYDIFVGKNKYVSFEWYSGTGRTGAVEVSPIFSGTSSYGISKGYDPTTGVVTVSIYTDAAYTSGSNFGLVPPGAATQHDGYFDIVVSENPLFVSSQALRSEVLLSSGNGYGSSSTKIRRFTNTLKNVGTAITYADSATLGATFTINEDGLYTVSFSDIGPASLWALGISRNSSQLTTNITSINDADIVALADGASSGRMRVSETLNLSAGDVIRPHGEAASSNTSSSVRFRIAKVAN